MNKPSRRRGVLRPGWPRRLALATALLVAACAPAPGPAASDLPPSAPPAPTATLSPGAACRATLGQATVAPGAPEDAPPSSLLRLQAGGQAATIAYHPTEQRQAAVMWLSGADGGLDGPHDGFYAGLAARLQPYGIASARLDYAAPMELEPSTCEALLTLRFLEQESYRQLAVVGFSFGGAVAIESAAEHGGIATIVTLGSQSLGTDRVAELAPRPLLAIHSADDTVVPAWASEDIYQRAGEPKDLVLLPTADHYLTDSSEQVHTLVFDWLRAHLPAQASVPGPES